MLKRLRLVDISVPRNRRQPMKGRVASVAYSMRNVGLLHPILVAEDGTRLIAGLTRLRAAECLDWKDILCNVVDFDKLHAELAEIDENVERSNLNALEESQALARRKAIYLELYPETAQGGDRRSKPQSAVLKTDEIPEKTPTFAQDTADKTGKSEDTIQRSVVIGENIAPAAAKALADTPVADSKTQLQQLVKLEPEQQVEVAKAIKSGEAETVKEASEIVGVSDSKPKRSKRSKNGKPTVDARMFKDLEQKIGAAIRSNTALKNHCGGADHHETIRQHLNAAIKEIATWRRSAMKA